jgi:chromate transporter
MKETGHRNVAFVLQIFRTFLKISPFAFGGGYALIALIEREAADRRKWLDSRELADIIALSQSVPGAVGMNAAMLIGYRLARLPGAIAAAAGVLVPAFAIVLTLGIVLLQFRQVPEVRAAFSSITAAVAALIAYAAFRLVRAAVVDKTAAFLIVSTVLALYFLDVHPVFLVLAGGAAGMAAEALRKRLGKPAKAAGRREPVYKYDDYFIGDGI